MKKQYLILAILFLIPASYVFAVKNEYIKPKKQVEKLLEFNLIAPDGKKVKLNLEVADTFEKRRIGLMARHSLDPKKGMLFVWNDKDIRSFWMKNTYIPLDMIFIDDNKVVGFVENAVPYSLQPRTVNHKVNLVLEVNAGFVKKYKLNKNWRVDYKL